MKSLAIAFLACAAWASGSAAAPAANSPAASPPADNLVILADWQGPMSLPPQFRNHCAYHVYRGRYFCANHCGFGYQFYYCLPDSYGCCHIGHGYCGWDGSLRCSP